jgi:hypothetical protein
MVKKINTLSLLIHSSSNPRFVRLRQKVGNSTLTIDDNCWPFSIIHWGFKRGSHDDIQPLGHVIVVAFFHSLFFIFYS